mmetsp:Transcript_37503/g.76641  ORF Transcript_37503/g.76641 Transcript_37503/m.76641 type:complete len:782 (-) Transcript_37503:103-2448(-)
MMTRITSLLSRLLLVASAMAVAAVDDYSGSISTHHSNNRSLQITPNAAITEDQYQTCLNDALTADQNGDYELSASEFIRFVTFNSAVYGYTWGYAAGQTSFDQMPLNFPMLFYTQACLCSQEAESSGCCSAERAHVNIFTGPKYGSGITEKQDVYMREFCTEAFHSYAVTLTPTPMPTPLPMTPAPTPSPVEEDTPSPTTPSPTPISTPDGTIATSPPTPPPTRTTPQPTTTQPTPSGTTSLLPVTVQYGISSDCGVTAYDVMTANGNTIKAGLEAATEITVIEILNTTSWPWAKSGSSPFRVANMPKKVGLEKNKVVAAKSEGGEDEVVELPHLIRYNELVPVGKRNGDDNVGGGVTYMLLNQQPRRQRLLKKGGLSSSDHRQQQQLQLSRGTNSRRNLVYYTSDNVEITDVEDSNNDQACPPGLNCMIVSSVVRVTLEPGDDPEIVGEMIEEGLQKSYQDGSFFQGIPEDTVLCPPEPSAMPSSSPSSSPTIASDGTAEPTPSPTPSVVDTPTAAPTSASSSVSPSSIASGTPVPSAPSTPITTGGNETMAPSMMPSPSTNSSSMSPSSMASDEAVVPSAMPSSPSVSSTTSPSAAATLQQLLITINYDIENQCGLDAEKVMNEDGNTLKSGLIAATTTVSIDTLNMTFPREGEERQRNMRGVQDNYDRDLVYIDVGPDPNNRVYYTDEYPVIIERILDIETGCESGTNCLLIISTVTVLMEPFDNENDVKKAVTEGISQSFRDGSFNSAIPSDTVICPTRGGIKFLPPEPARLRARKR